MLNQMADERSGCLGDIHVERITDSRQVEAKLCCQRLGTVPCREHDLAGLDHSFGCCDTEATAVLLNMQNRLLPELYRAARARPAPHSGICQKRIDFALVRAELGTDNNRSKIWCNSIKFGTVKNRH